MARINNVHKSSLQYLTKGIHYNMVDAHALEPRKISHPIPYDTGMFMNGRFPAYLHGFENYYEEKRGFWHLKREYYYENRPQYTIEITPIVYDIVLTPWGEDAVQERFKKYQRLAKRYNAFLNQ